MEKIKVGDKVRVVSALSRRRPSIGDVLIVAEVRFNGFIWATDEDCGWFLDPDEYEPIAPGLIVAGGEYTSDSGHEWKCISVDGDYAWLTSVNEKSAAYVFKTDGTNISQGGGEWNIKFEPVVKTVNVVGGIKRLYNSDEFITFNGHTGDHKFNMTVDFIDGKPDWSTAKVTPA